MTIDVIKRIQEEPGCSFGLIACPNAGLGVNAQNRCIQACNRCNGREDCPGGADEEGCCAKDEFTCSGEVIVNGTNFEKQECIPITKHCDDHEDCNDGSDEEICPPGRKPLCSLDMNHLCKSELSIINSFFLFSLFLIF